jgi:hypothetical protein
MGLDGGKSSTGPFCLGMLSASLTKVSFLIGPVADWRSAQQDLKKDENQRG